MHCCGDQPSQGHNCFSQQKTCLLSCYWHPWMEHCPRRHFAIPAFPWNSHSPKSRIRRTLTLFLQKGRNSKVHGLGNRIQCGHWICMQDIPPCWHNCSRRTQLHSAKILGTGSIWGLSQQRNLDSWLFWCFPCLGQREQTAREKGKWHEKGRVEDVVLTDALCKLAVLPLAHTIHAQPATEKDLHCKIHPVPPLASLFFFLIHLFNLTNKNGIIYFINYGLRTAIYPTYMQFSYDQVKVSKSAKCMPAALIRLLRVQS